MPAKPNVDRTIESIYAAALHPGEWTNALRNISNCLATTASCVFVANRTGNQMMHWTGVGLEFGQTEYTSHYASIDPRRVFAEANPHTRIHYDRMLIDERGMDRNEFYAWQERHPDRLRYFIGCRVEIDSDHSGFAAFHWPRSHGHAQSADIKLFKRIAPHLERSLQLSTHLGVLKQNLAAVRSMLEGLHQAIVLLDGAGIIVECNRRAREIIAANDGLATADRKLVARHSGDNAVLLQAIRNSVGTPPTVGGALAISRISGRRSYVITISPLPRAAAAFSLGAPIVAVLIVDPDQQPELPEASMMRIYRLTRAEARIANLIVAGRTTDQAADELGIAKTTARLHLQRILAKTGTHRQSELVRLLLTTIPPATNSF